MNSPTLLKSRLRRKPRWSTVWNWPFVIMMWIFAWIFSVHAAGATETKSSDTTPKWAIESASQELAIGRVLLRYPPALERDAQMLAQHIPSWWSQIEKTLAGDLDDQLIITYVTHSGRIADATGVPHWAAGVARPSSGEIVIAQHNPDGSLAELDDLLRHEMAHVALHRAVDGAPLPQWFHEGVAESFASRIDFARHQSLAKAVFSAEVPTMHQLEGSFRMEDQEVAAAYASSRDFVNFLRDRDLDGSQLRQLLLKLQQGQAFSAAFTSTYGKTVEELESEWRSGLWGRLRWTALVDTGGLPWLFLVPLLMMAWWRQRKKLRAAWARIDQEEQTSIPFQHPLPLAVKNA